MTLALALIAVVAGSGVLKFLTVGGGLVLAAIICIGTFRSGCLRDPLDDLEPLDGDPLDEGWGKL